MERHLSYLSNLSSPGWTPRSDSSSPPPCRAAFLRLLSTIIMVDASIRPKGFPVGHGHRRYEPRNGSLNRHAHQRGLWLRHHPSQDDLGEFPSPLRGDVPMLTCRQDTMVKEQGCFKFGPSESVTHLNEGSTGGASMISASPCAIQ